MNIIKLDPPLKVEKLLGHMTVTSLPAVGLSIFSSGQVYND